MKNFFNPKDIVICESFDDGSTLLVIVVNKSISFYHLVGCIHSLLTFMQNLLYKGPNTCKTCDLRLAIVTDLGGCPLAPSIVTVRRTFNGRTGINKIRDEIFSKALKADMCLINDFNYVCIYTKPSKNPTHAYTNIRHPSMMWTISIQIYK